jgi:5-formyltetrahydrofolate cyclo-ligase
MIDRAAAKKQLRQQLLTARQALNGETWQKMSQKLCDQLSHLTSFQQARTILAYSSTHQEPDLRYLLAQPSHHQHCWGLPRCVGKSLVWHRWQPQEKLIKGAFNLLEPPSSAPMINAAEADLILVPAVAVDKRGYRLGYGGGFYDRMLAAPPWQGIRTIGIVFDFAYLSALPVEPWDLPLDEICTEERHCLAANS